MLTLACIYMMIKTGDEGYWLGAVIALILEVYALVGVIQALK